MFSADMNIKDFDPELAQAIENEDKRQEEHIELIASENYTSPRVLEAQGSQLTNKYAEGYPGKRYYGGCEYVDIAEQLAIDRAKKLFGADYANVQPHSGSQANAAVFMALCSPGDTVLGMSLAHGGHLTHGSHVSFSGKIYNAVQYGLNAETGEVDYEQVAELAREHKPKMIIAGFSAYSKIMDWQKFRDIADEVGAYLFVDMAHVAGLVAAGIYPNPVPIADVVTSTTHKTLRGPRGGIILAKANDEITKKFNSSIFPGTQGGPLMHVIAAKAVAFKEAMEPKRSPIIWRQGAASGVFATPFAATRPWPTRKPGQNSWRFTLRKPFPSYSLTKVNTGARIVGEWSHGPLRSHSRASRRVWLRCNAPRPPACPISASWGCPTRPCRRRANGCAPPFRPWQLPCPPSG